MRLRSTMVRDVVSGSVILISGYPSACRGKPSGATHTRIIIADFRLLTADSEHSRLFRSPAESIISFVFASNERATLLTALVRFFPMGGVCCCLCVKVFCLCKDLNACRCVPVCEGILEQQNGRNTPHPRCGSIRLFPVHGAHQAGI